LSPNLPSTIPNQKPLKLKSNKDSLKIKFQKMSQDVNFTTIPEILVNDNLYDNIVHIGDFVLVKYKGKHFFNILLDVLMI